MLHGTYAHVAVHNCENPLISGYVEVNEKEPVMGFVNEFFSRNRSPEAVRYRNSMTMLDALSPAERADLGIKPADFPRVAREMAARGR